MHHQHKLYEGCEEFRSGKRDLDRLWLIDSKNRIPEPVDHRDGSATTATTGGGGGSYDDDDEGIQEHNDGKLALTTFDVKVSTNYFDYPVSSLELININIPKCALKNNRRGKTRFTHVPSLNLIPNMVLRYQYVGMNSSSSSFAGTIQFLSQLNPVQITTVASTPLDTKDTCGAVGDPSYVRVSYDPRTAAATTEDQDQKEEDQFCGSEDEDWNGTLFSLRSIEACPWTHVNVQSSSLDNCGSLAHASMT
mmetsp:Transcript_19434/g.30845  ORF Transcript_19434/g.30845 Transcript_19434/m.30845 type:complete len:250 (-) Transcript_19434:65-814(-)